MGHGQCHLSLETQSNELGKTLLRYRVWPCWICRSSRVPRNLQLKYQQSGCKRWRQSYWQLRVSSVFFIYFISLGTTSKFPPTALQHTDADLDVWGQRREPSQEALPKQPLTLTFVDCPYFATQLDLDDAIVQIQNPGISRLKANTRKSLETGLDQGEMRTRSPKQEVE